MLENQAMRTASYSNSPNLGIIIFVHLYSEIVFLLIIISPFPQAYQVCGGEKIPITTVCMWVCVVYLDDMVCVCGMCVCSLAAPCLTGLSYK